MSLRKPPALATWLLNRFGLPETNAPLAGDLVEEFQNGRSRAWYWRQTLVAIATLLRKNSRGRLMGAFLDWVSQVGFVEVLWWLRWQHHIRPLYLVLALWVVLSNAVIIGLGLGGLAPKRLLSALGRFVSSLRFLGVVAFFIPLSKPLLLWLGLTWLVRRAASEMVPPSLTTR